MYKELLHRHTQVTLPYGAPSRKTFKLSSAVSMGEKAQTKMGGGAVYGGLIPDTDTGKARTRFVTRG